MNKGNLTISRPQGRGPEVMTIRVNDAASRVCVCEVSIGLAEFIKCLTGLAHTEMEFNHGDLSKVGKKMEHRKISVKIKDYDFSNRKEVATKAALENTPEGWEPDCYFSSQDSFYTKDGEDYARCMIRRWVNETE